MATKKDAPEHGTRARYVSRTHPCHCDECKKAHNEYMAEYRRRRRNRGHRLRD